MTDKQPLSREPSGARSETKPEYVMPYGAEYAGGGIDLHAAWSILLQRKIMIGVTVLVSTLFFAGFAFLSTPVYRAEVLLAPASAIADASNKNILSTQFSGLASLVGANTDQRGLKDEALAVLLSRSFTGDFVRDENLLPVLFPEDWNADENRWRQMDASRIPAIPDAYEVIDKKIRRIVEDQTTGLVTLSIEWVDPVLAARWANMLVSRLNEHLRREAISDAQRRIEFLNTELEKTGVVGLRQGIFNLIQTQVEAAMLANVSEEFAFKVLDPAEVPEDDRYVRPKRALLIAIGVLAGLLAGIFVALLGGRSAR